MLGDFQTLGNTINQKAEVIERFTNGRFLPKHPLSGSPGAQRLFLQGEAKRSLAKS